MDATPNPPTVPSDPSTNQWQVAMHLCPLVGFVIPFGNLLTPLILWLIKRQESPTLDQAGKDVLNFQISISIYAILSIVLWFILIGFVLSFLVFILWLYGMVMAAMKVGTNETFRYPFTIHFLR